MNGRAVAYLVAEMMLVLAAALVAAAVVALLHAEDGPARALLASAAVAGAPSLVVAALCRGALHGPGGRAEVYRREGLAAVGIGWVAAAAVGALPFLLSGVLPWDPVDALFESASGFTTTGASVLTAAQIDALPRGIAFWRSLSHWLGGAGIVVVLVVVLPTGGRSLFRSEVPGVHREPVLQRVRDSAWAVLRAYLALSTALFAALLALGMPVFDAAIHTFGTIATGGFSSRGASVAYYDSAPIELVLVLFMFLAGTNFAVYHTLFRKGPLAAGRELARSSEWRLYASLVLLGALGVALVLWTSAGGDVAPEYRSFGRSLRDALFAVTSVCTTTGYATADFDRWPEICRLFLLLLFVTGACAGSTAGGIKLIRVVVIGKAVLRAVRHYTRPRALATLRVDGRAVDEAVVDGVARFFLVWTAALVVGSFLLVASGTTILEGVTSVASALGNVGPGVGRFGPAGSYAEMSEVGKVVLAVWMILGRLEFYALVALVLPRFWRH